MIAAAPERAAVATHPNAIGGILIVVGTCIGAGLLALPVSNSPGGFGYSIVVMVFVWAVTTLGALFVFEVTQWLPRGSNIVSIARATLGRKAEAVAWIVYLLLCYSLLCAYISGGADILAGLTQGLSPGLMRPAAAAAFTLVLGSIVLRGIRSLDLVNRGLMLVKLATFALLIFLISPHIDSDKLRQGELRLVLSSVSVAVTSFGFAIVIPSLLDYFDGNVRKVRTIILAGSLIPLGCYITWNTVVMGTLPRMGPDGLLQVLASGDATDGLVKGLKDVLKVPAVTDASELFASICVLTSFLGVSLALFDFLRCAPWRAKRGRVVPGRRRRGRVAVGAQGRESRSRGGNMQSASETPSSHSRRGHGETRQRAAGRAPW